MTHGGIEIRTETLCEKVGCGVDFLLLIHAMLSTPVMISEEVSVLILLGAIAQLLHASSNAGPCGKAFDIVTFGGLIVLIMSLDYVQFDVG